MKLLGEWNWYLPRWLRWLPEVPLAAPPPAPTAPDFDFDELPVRHRPRASRAL